MRVNRAGWKYKIEYYHSIRINRMWEVNYPVVGYNSPSQHVRFKWNLSRALVFYNVLFYSNSNNAREAFWIFSSTCQPKNNQFLQRTMKIFCFSIQPIPLPSTMLILKLKNYVKLGQIKSDPWHKTHIVTSLTICWIWEMTEPWIHRQSWCLDVRVFISISNLMDRNIV